MKSFRKFVLITLLLILTVVAIFQFIMVRFKVESKYKNISFRISPVIGNLFLIKTGLWTKVQDVKLVLTPERQDLLPNYDGANKTLISTMSIKKRGSNVEIWANYDSQYIIQLASEKDRLDKDLLLYLCTTITNEKDIRNCNTKASEFISWKNDFGFGEFVGQSKKISLGIVKTAHAQSCTGQIYCGQLGTWCTCSVSGYTCSVGSQDGTRCGPGTCYNCSYQCNSNVGTLNCSGITNSTQCNNTTSTSCGVGSCISIEQSCSWSTGGGGGSTPPPEPSCNCGTQQCDSKTTTPGCTCFDIGCKVNTRDGASCVAYTCGGSGPTPPPVNNPKGYHDSSACDYSYGWTCDADNYSSLLTVNFYKDGPPGTGTFIGSTLANVAAEAGVAVACGGYANHRFNFLTPDSVKDNSPHTIYAQAVNIGSGSNILLTDTPKTVTCTPVCNLTYPTNLNITNQTPVSSTFNWTPATTPGTSQLLRVGSDLTAVENGCPSGTGPGTGCVVKATLSASANSYNVTGLTSGTTYFYRIVNYKDVSCYKDVVISAQSGYAASWWQVKDSDVMASAVSSEIPTSATAPYFNLVGTGGFPGVVIYSGTTNLNNTNVSTKGWLANPSSLIMGATYDSAYFLNSVPSSIAPYTVAAGSTFNMAGNVTPAAADANGYKWFKYSGTNLPLTIGNLAVGNEKIILLVDGANVTITGNITRNVGTGFFLLVTSGKVTVSPAVGGGAVPNLEGIFVSDGDFETGTNAPAADSKLWVRGTVVSSHGSVRLPRTLGAGNSTTAPYLFEYAPDLDLLFPSALAKHSTVWREIAP